WDFRSSEGQAPPTLNVEYTLGAHEPNEPFSGVVSPTVETAALPGTFDAGDVADDPAIWIDKNDPTRSLIIGTDKDPKQGRLYAFDLQGKVINTTSFGEFNNVDLRYGFNLGGQLVDLVGATNRGTNSIDFFALDPVTRELNPVGSVPTGLSNIYGFTMGHTADGKYYAFVSNTGSYEDSTEATTVRQFELVGSSGKVTGQAVRTFSHGTQVEGMVVDDQTGALYLAEENVGIWKYG
ncbi:phytase, partial [Microvirga aerilata]|uniref:phytase n=1 Tax=Microvirga aerilata TaxID=670292 RepID=UPI003611E1F8